MNPRLIVVRPKDNTGTPIANEGEFFKFQNIGLKITLNCNVKTDNLL